MRGNLPNNSKYVSLAKQEQMNISSSLSLLRADVEIWCWELMLRADVERRGSLISHANNLYDSKLVKEEMKDKVNDTITISDALVNSSKYQL